MIEESLELLTVREVARLMQLEEESVGHLAEEGRLPARRIGGEWRFPRRDLERYVLSDGEADFRDFYIRALDMYITVDREQLEIRACNPAVFRATGYGAEEVAGRPLRALFHPPSRKRWAGGEEELRGTGRLDRSRLQIARKDGSSLEVHVLGESIRDDEGRVAGYQLILRDLSEQRSAEEAADFLRQGIDRRIEISTRELRQANLELRHEVSDLKREVKRLKGQLDEAGRTAGAPHGADTTRNSTHA